jgi:THO complex subunit 7
VVPHLTTLRVDGSRPTVADAREAFLVELESFHLSLKKSVMICEAEARQVEEYQKEKQRIRMCVQERPFIQNSDFFSEAEHGKLLGQIEQLKTALEHAQTIRKRKIEYDLVAEKINVLPSREELDQ